MTTRCAPYLALLVAMAQGCTDEDPMIGGGGGDDAGSGGDGSVEMPDPVEPELPAPPAPPVPPEPVRMTPCPDGWREVADPGDPTLVTCDPWPEGRPGDCAEDEAHFPGRPGCERIGTECPEDSWPADIPEGAPVVYVRAGEPAGGDGTLERPFGTITDALDAARDGDVLALSKGLFDESVRIDRMVTLLGACVLETRIAPTRAGQEPAALTLRAAATIRNLQVGGSIRGIDVGDAGSSVELDSIVVRQATEAGINVGAGGVLDAADVAVRDTGGLDGNFGIGLQVSARGQVSLERAAFEGNRTIGVVAADEGTTLVASDLVVRDTLAQQSDGNFGVGLDVYGSAQVTLERAAFERNRFTGVIAFGAGTGLAASHLVVRDTLAQQSDGDHGYGLQLFGGAQATVERAAFDGNRSGGVVVFDEGTTLGAFDLVVRGTLARKSDGKFGLGLQASGGAQVTLERAAFERNGFTGVMAFDVGTGLAASDLVVRDTLAHELNGTFGIGLQVWLGAQATIERAAFEGNRTVGILAGEAGATLVASDLAVTETLGQQSDGAFGNGLDAYGGAQVTVERAALEGNRNVGVLASDAGTTLRASDLVVRDTLAQESDGTYGLGLQAWAGAQVTLERAAFEGNRNVGVAAVDEDTTLTASDLLIADTLPVDAHTRRGDGLVVVMAAAVLLVRCHIHDNRNYGIRAQGSTVTAVDLVVERTGQQQCAVDTCPSTTGGFGISAEEGAIVELTRFRSSGNALAGVVVASEAGIDLHEGLVSDNLIGANVQVSGFDLARLQDDVLYLDNGRNLDAAILPLPDPPETLDIGLPEP